MRKTRSDSWGWCGVLGAAVVVVAIALASFPERALAQEAADRPITFSRDVAPILQQNCQVCHRAGSIGPMSLLTYEDARPWRSRIKMQVASREMPPYQYDADVGIQELKYDPRLSADEIETIIRWVDAGAPEGDPADMPPAVKWPDPGEWRLAERFGPAGSRGSREAQDHPGSGSGTFGGSPS